MSQLVTRNSYLRFNAAFCSLTKIPVDEMLQITRGKTVVDEVL